MIKKIRSILVKLKFLKALYRIMTNTKDCSSFELFDIAVHLKNEPGLFDEPIKHFKKSEQGLNAINNRVRVEINREYLKTLPENTLGKQYFNFIKDYDNINFIIDNKEIITDPDYLIAHYFESHDILHVLLNIPTTANGEFAMQAFNMSQYPPGKLASAVVGAGIVNILFQKDIYLSRTRMKAISDAFQMGLNAKSTFGADWKSFWDWPIEKVRAEFDIVPMQWN
jgi:ubiquinone biosynthesis protein Coq4